MPPSFSSFTRGCSWWFGLPDRSYPRSTGYGPYAAGLYLYVQDGTEWLLLFGAATCGISAGFFWSSQTALIISYPEDWRRGRAIGVLLTSQLVGQAVCGAVSLGFNAKARHAGKFSATAFILFITISAAAPFVASLLTPPAKLEREDGREVKFEIAGGRWQRELLECSKCLLDKRFLMLQPLFGMAWGAESVYWSYLDEWFTVRTRALDSLIGGICSVICGNLLGVSHNHLMTICPLLCDYSRGCRVRALK